MESIIIALFFRVIVVSEKFHRSSMHSSYVTMDKYAFKPPTRHPVEVCGMRGAPQKELNNVVLYSLSLLNNFAIFLYILIFQNINYSFRVHKNCFGAGKFRYHKILILSTIVKFYG